MSSNEAFCAYLKQGHFDSFMEKWKEQFIKYGTCKGSIQLELNETNRADINGLLGKDCRQKVVRISFRTLKKALEQTRFDNCDFDEVLKLYFHGYIETNLDKREKEKAERDAFFHRLDNENIGICKAWLQDCIDTKNAVYLRMVKEWKGHRATVISSTLQAFQALNALPVFSKSKENMAIFACQFTNDPHAFDRNTYQRYLLIQGIVYFLHLSKDMDENELLYRAGIYQDGISNYCVIARLLGRLEDGTIHSGWKGFYDRYESIHVTMDNLFSVATIDQTSCRRVYIVENPSIFQLLLKRIRLEQRSDIGLVCTNGQLNFAAHYLLDMLSKTKIKLYYAGDMDPEGLLIAQKMKDQYPITLWHYTLKDYNQSISNKQASELRLQMMDKLEDKELLLIKSAILAHSGQVGYQENDVVSYRSENL